MNLTLPTIGYSALVSLVILMVLIAFHYWLARIERGRLKTLEGRNKFEAVATQTPLDDPTLHAMERGAQNIETRFAYLKKIIYPFIFCTWVILLAIPHMGTIPSIYTSLIVAAVSLLLGIAARPFIENVFAGMTISFSKSVRIGDTVLVDEQYGTVEEITLTHTVIKSWDWRRYVIPNAKLIQKEFLNYSLHDRYIWAFVEFYVEGHADLSLVEKIAIKAMNDSTYFDHNKFETPVFWVMGMEKEAIKCWVAAWASSPSIAWNLKHDVRMRLNRALREHQLHSHSYHIGKPGPGPLR